MKQSELPGSLFWSNIQWGHMEGVKGGSVIWTHNTPKTYFLVQFGLYHSFILLCIVGIAAFYVLSASLVPQPETLGEPVDEIGCETWWVADVF